jgi:hypothetical protein
VDRRQGWAVAAVMAVLLVVSMSITVSVESHGHTTTAIAAGQPVEGKDTRFGVGASAAFGAAATNTADGAANSSYDSFTPLAGGTLLVNMMLGEVSPGGIGSGLYGLPAGRRAHLTSRPPPRVMTQASARRNAIKAASATMNFAIACPPDLPPLPVPVPVPTVTARRGRVSSSGVRTDGQSCRKPVNAADGL